MADLNSPNYTNFLNTVNRFSLAKLYNFRIKEIVNPPMGLVLPGGSSSSITLLIKALSLPSRKINTTMVPYRAFEFNIPTNAAFPENQSWQITVLSDKALLFRDYFEKWSEKIYNIDNNTQMFVNTQIQFALYAKVSKNSNSTNALQGATKSSADSEQNMDIVDLRTYTLWGAYPILVGGIAYNYSDQGTEFASFNVSFGYQYFTTTSGSQADIQRAGAAPARRQTSQAPDNSNSANNRPLPTFDYTLNGTNANNKSGETK